MKALLHKQYQELEESHWWFVVRRKIIFGLIKNIVDERKEAAILDFGCNSGVFVNYLQQQGYNAKGVDVSEEAINFGRERGTRNLVHFKANVQDLEKEIYPGQKFDIILALDVLEHIQDDQKDFNFLWEKLNPGGSLIVTVPAYMWMWGVQDVVSEHKRRYSASSLKKLTNCRSDLFVEKLTYFNTILFLPIVFTRLIQRIKPPKRVSDFSLNGLFINGFFKYIFGLEKSIIRYTKLPFGVSVLGVFVKENGKRKY